jgi:argininosuccinate lyase
MRDVERLDSCYERINLSPLGACAIGGSSIPLDRRRIANLLGFSGIVNNSIDATSSRDSLLEFASHIAILMTNLSRMAEDLIIWSTTEFSFVELSDKFSSTSSAMPQKKNPDPLELTRSKTSLVIGDLVSMLSMIKSLPSGYSRDLQDFKPPLFDATSKTLGTIGIITAIFSSLSVHADKMYESARQSYAIALDLAEQLVIEQKIPFRVAHRLVGNLIKRAYSLGIPINQLSQLQVREAMQVSKVENVDGDMIIALIIRTSPKKSLSDRKTVGSPSVSEQSRSILDLSRKMAAHTKVIQFRVAKERRSLTNLDRLVRQFVES